MSLQEKFANTLLATVEDMYIFKPYMSQKDLI